MKVLMVCLGNICRSPLAEGIMREKGNKYGLNLEVDSAGTNSYHIGESPDTRSKEIAEKYGIDISMQKARQFKIQDFDKFDLIFAMDGSNYSDLAAMARNQADTQKLNMIMNIVKPGSNKAVPDPYYGGNDGFQHVFDMLDEACEMIAKKIANNDLNNG